MRRIATKLGYWILVAVLFCCGAEAASRVDDWVQRGTPLLATPDYDRDLILREGDRVRGKPHGQYKKWRLNAFGFLGPEMPAKPDPQRPRVLILGASETFGFFASENKEFPAQLGARLTDCEVVNAAIVGMTVRSMVLFWEDWASRFEPLVVVIYPPPQFYLADTLPAWPTDTTPATPDPPPASVAVKSRFVDRLHDLVHYPQFIQKLRNERAIQAHLADKPNDWPFRAPPQDRLDAFANDLARLVRSIQARGGKVVLVTHAMKATSPPRAEDLEVLQAARVHIPRATPEVIVAFEAAARQVVLAVGRAENVTVVDAAAVLSGRRECFGDLVHFTDAGAAILAELLEQPVRQAARHP